MRPPPPKLPKVERVWVGIDPGFAGAIGVIDQAGRYLDCFDMPVRGTGRGSEMDLMRLCEIITWIKQWPIERVRLEWVQTRPDESPESSKRFGVGLGNLEMAFLWATGHTVERVAPSEWKPRLGLVGKEKDALAARKQAVQAAYTFIRCLPDKALEGPKGGLKDGRAEALLLAWEGLTRTRQGLLNQPEDVRMARLLMGSSRPRRRSGNVNL